MRVFRRYAGGVIFFPVSYDKPRSSESFDAFAAHYLRGGWGLSPKGSVTLGGFEGRSYSVTARPRGSFSYELHALLPRRQGRPPCLAVRHRRTQLQHLLKGKWTVDGSH